MKKILMVLLVAGVLLAETVTTFGQGTFQQFAKLNLRLPDQSSRHEVEQAKAPRGLSQAERIKCGLAMMGQELPIGNWDRMRTSIDLSEPLDSNRRVLSLDTVYFGQGNAQTATTTVDLIQVPVKKRVRFTWSLIFIDPSKDQNVWVGGVLRIGLGR